MKRYPPPCSVLHVLRYINTLYSTEHIVHTIYRIYEVKDKLKKKNRIPHKSMFPNIFLLDAPCGAQKSHRAL